MEPPPFIQAHKGRDTISNDLIGLGLVILLALLNAFFVATEYSFVSIRRTRLDELIAQHKPGAQAALSILNSLDRAIAATQLGVTLTSLALGWVGEPALSHLVEPLVDWIPFPPALASITTHGFSVVIAFIGITFLHVVLGELTPKSMAIQRSENVALAVATPMLWIMRFFSPAVWALNQPSNLMLKVLGLKPVSGHELVHSVEELKMVVAASADQGVLEIAEHDMVDAIFNLRDMMIRQVMIPRTEVAALPVTATLEDVLTLQKDHPHGKFPVYENDMDHIVGILYVQDILNKLAEGKPRTRIRKMIREAIFLPQTARINAAIKTFQETRQHSAIVLDEYGGTAGLVTLGDILAEIAGDIPDPFDTEENPEIVQRDEHSWVVDGLALIETVNEALGLALADDNYDTIGGYVMGKLEHIPHVGDEIRSESAHFRVEQVDGMRVERLHVTLER